MSAETLIQDPTPLQPHHHPSDPVDREEELEEFEGLLSQLEDVGGVNLHLYGPRGSGKTMAATYTTANLPDSIHICYVDCQRFDTQYKALRQICRSVANEEINSGHHTSQLQRIFEKHSSQLHTVILLDDIDFLLLNDGNDLLYYLSRIDHSNKLAVVTISANHSDLQSEVEERTHSSLQPQVIHFYPYDQETARSILSQRAEHSLTPRTLHREALQQITRSTHNTTLGLIWIETAANSVDDVITEETIRNVEQKADRRYVDYQLRNFSRHHNLVYQAVQELSKEQDPPIQAGQIYDRYQKLCGTYSEESLSDRRISDYIKHLELLGVIKAEYHYGGSMGKTREVHLRRFSQHSPK